MHSVSAQTIGVVTITYNSASVIVPFMESVLSQTHKDFILYIIDNLSSDNTLALVDQFNDERIRVVANKENVGVAAGNNQGMLMAINDGCPYIMLLNNDVEFEATLFEKLLHEMSTRNYSLATCKMMYHNEKDRIWYAGCKWDIKGGYMAPHIGQKELDRGQYDQIGEADYAPTCCVLMKKEVVDDIGWMDEKYFAYFDDTDFFYRIHQDGRHKILYYPHVNFYHKVGGLTKSKSGTATKFKFGNFHIRLSTRNKVYYLLKQKTLHSKWVVLYFFFRMNLRFFFSGKYHLNFSTWKLLNKAYFEGINMGRHTS
jgi:GT2 family glycosyltransferase